MDFIGQLSGALAGSPWALPAVAGLLIVDGFFPFVPAETLVVGLSAAVAASGGDPWLILAVAVPASIVGDLIAYTVGRRLGVARWRVMRRPKVAAMFAYTRRRLEVSPASILLTAKFVPVVRGVVPITAGAGRMPLRRYFPMTLVSVVAYTSFHVAVGAAAASWLPDPAFALVGGMAAAAVIGMAIDLAAKAVTRVRQGSGRGRERQKSPGAQLVPRNVPPAAQLPPSSRASRRCGTRPLCQAGRIRGLAALRSRCAMSVACGILMVDSSRAD